MAIQLWLLLILLHAQKAYLCSIAERSVGDKTQWHEYCEVDGALAEIQDKFRGVRTDCACSKTPDVEDTLCSLDRNVDSLRRKCECQSTDAIGTTSDYEPWESSTLYPPSSSSGYPEAETTTADYTPDYHACPNWTTEFQNHCYFMSYYDETWLGAMYGCRNSAYGLGAYLVRVDSEAEHDFIIDLWNSTTSDTPIGKGPWIGAYRFPIEYNAWTWLPSFQVVGWGYENWYSWDYNDLYEAGKECARYVGLDQNTGECVLKWQNYDCNTFAPYICEFDLVGSFPYQDNMSV